MKEDLRSLYDSFDKFFQEGYAKGIIRMHMSRIGTLGGKVRSEKKRKACAENAKKRWVKVREQTRQAEPGKIGKGTGDSSGGEANQAGK